MIKFADEAVIEVSSGRGGNGCIAFRREKYVPMGGPAGGDGGRGGDVVFHVKKNLRTLAHLRYKQLFRARNGADGEGRNKFGKDGDDIVIPVPPGTILKDFETGEVIREFTVEHEDDFFILLTGGNGGWGNSHFKTSTNQAPRIALEGKPAETRKLRVELNIMADVGLVGFPNAGKSSLLDFFTNARPKIAPYPFTTKIPNLGILRVNQDRDIIIADIPGIIEGAADGAGLGTRFLKHIARTAGLIFIIDVSDDNYLTAFETLWGELEKFSPKLAAKPKIVLCNKLDLDGARERFEKVREKLAGMTVLGMSIHAREGMDSVRRAIVSLVDEVEESRAREKPAKTVEGNFCGDSPQVIQNCGEEKSSFLGSRSVCENEPVQYPGSQEV